MSIRLKSLELESFKSFKKRTVFDFPQGDAVVAVCGHWKGSSVQSGAGKTSVLEGLAWCLDISDASVESLTHWYGDSKPYGKTTLLDEQNVIEVIKDPKLKLVINGVPWNSQVKGAKEKLREILGKNKEMVKAITYRKQKVRGKIVNSTDSELKEFLTQPLGLDEIELAADTFTKSTNTIIAALDLLKRDIQNLELTVPMNAVSDTEMDAAIESYTAACNAYQVAKARVEEMQAQDSGTAGLRAEASACKEEVKKIHALNTSIAARKQNNASYKVNILALQKEISELEKNACPTCKREWNAALALKESKMIEVDRLIHALEVNIEYIAASEPVVANLGPLELKLQELNAKIGELSSPIQMAAASFDNATTSANNAKNNYDTLVKKRSNHAILAEKLEKTKADIAAKERDLAIDQGVSLLLGRTGFLGSIFDEILTDIEVRTNDMLSHFPNASHLTVQISSTKFVKTKGTTKKEISIGVSRNGMDLSMDDISGGQQSAVELCSDLGSAEAIIARSGGALKWLCLDEVLDGLGPEEKKAVVAMIKDRFKGLVLMIEHATEIRESFDQVINIEYDGKESYVTSA